MCMLKEVLAFHPSMPPYTVHACITKDEQVKSKLIIRLGREAMKRKGLNIQGEYELTPCCHELNPVAEILLCCYAKSVTFGGKLSQIWMSSVAHCLVKLNMHSKCPAHAGIT